LDHSSVSFVVTSQPVSTAISALIKATYRGVTHGDSILVQPLALSSITFPNGNYMFGGRNANAILSLNGPASAGGTSVSLSSSNSAVANPASPSVTVPAGVSRASFVLHTSAVTADTYVHIRATFAGVTKTVTIRVDATRRVSMSGNAFSPSQIYAAPGDVIIWTNNDSQVHTVTRDTATGPDSGSLAKGQTYPYTVPLAAVAGSKIFYHDQFKGHAGNGSAQGTGMAGTIIVQ
jgi:plastocyanin